MLWLSRLGGGGEWLKREGGRVKSGGAHKSWGGVESFPYAVGGFNSGCNAVNVCPSTFLQPLTFSGARGSAVG